MISLSARLFSLKRALGYKNKSQLADDLGVSRSMLYNYEKEDPVAPPEVFEKLAELEKRTGIGQNTNSQIGQKSGPPGAHVSNRRIKVVSWAHAGDAVSYEELPHEWQEEIVTDCRDVNAFALRLEGDSMESRGATSFTEGDLIITMPSKKPYSGCYVVCRFADDGGILFRRLETAGSTLKLIPLNDRYTITEHQEEEFSWIYPVWGRWSQLWKG